ncbi:MAG: hypothetical protein KGH66_02645, partial [Candidatus Micrarchaeota archaeon]|nr:hypothetical protein [Candidatus Micrarchaeota archaeon]
ASLKEEFGADVVRWYCFIVTGVANCEFIKIGMEAKVIRKITGENSAAKKGVYSYITGAEEEKVRELAGKGWNPSQIGREIERAKTTVRNYMGRNKIYYEKGKPGRGNNNSNLLRNDG